MISTRSNRFTENILQQKNIAILRSVRADGKPVWLAFFSPETVLQAWQTADVLPVLREIESLTSKGRSVAGFIAYEAASAFDPANKTREQSALPLLWFGVYSDVQELERLPDEEEEGIEFRKWEPSISLPEYLQKIETIRGHIARGDTYQVNFTMRMRSQFQEDPWKLFLGLNRAQRVRYSAYLHTEKFSLCSVSPELFFQLQGNEILCRPMKGTIRRGVRIEEDILRARELRASVKDRAENAMIVDMVRNDLGRIARIGSVQVPHLFSVERYDTVFQMTSTVTAQTDASLSEIFRALFPCASITGAPKISTMQIVAELETEPRGIYTGCIGFVAPGRRAQFNVAIRTVAVNHENKTAEYGTGGGIVWDSRPTAEYDECLAKAQILLAPRPVFRLLETILWRREHGFFLLEEHLTRLKCSARYFRFRIDVEIIRSLLAQSVDAVSDSRCAIRLLLSLDGEAQCEIVPIPSAPAINRWKVTLAREPIQKENPFLYHKTTNRAVCEHAKKDFPECDDVILWNEEGQVTESTRANVAARIGGELITPPVECGLLNGVYRGHLLVRRRIREGILLKNDLYRAERVYLVNSVRGWIVAQILEE